MEGGDSKGGKTIKSAVLLTLWLCQPQCESGVLLHDGFRCGRAIAQRAVRMNPIVRVAMQS